MVKFVLISQLISGRKEMLCQCWASVADGGLTLIQHRTHVWCFMWQICLVDIPRSWLGWMAEDNETSRKVPWRYCQPLIIISLFIFSNVDRRWSFSAHVSPFCSAAFPLGIQEVGVFVPPIQISPNHLGPCFFKFPEGHALRLRTPRILLDGHPETPFLLGWTLRRDLVGKYIILQYIFFNI